MELTDKEKEVLTIMHRAKMVGGKFFAEFEDFVMKRLEMDYKELNKIINKLIKEKLLEQSDAGDGATYYRHTSNVTEDMLDEDLVLLGY